MLKNIWITLPISLMCVLSHAAATTTTTASSTPANTLAAPAATTPAAPAAAPAAATSTAEVKKDEAPKASWGITLGVDYSIQAKKQPDGSRSEGNEYSAEPSLKYGDYTYKIKAAYEQDLKDTGSTGTFKNPELKLSRKGWTLNDYFKLSPSAVMVLPMKESDKNNGMLYNLGGTLSLSLNTKTLGMDALSLGYAVGYTRMATQYDTSPAGDLMTQHRVRQTISAGYSFTDTISLFTMFFLDSSVNSAGTVRNAFFHLESLGYQITDTLSVSVSHSLYNSLLNPKKDYGSNLKFVDDSESYLGVGLELAL